MKEKLDYVILKTKLISEIDAIKGELRAEIILLQAHVEFMIDEIIEILIESNAMRGTRARLELKLQILKNLDWLPDDFVQDVIKLSVIRGFVAHRIEIYDEKTREDIELQFKQIKLIGKADPDVFPKDESLQKHLRIVSELYLEILYFIYNDIYEKKKNHSITNPMIIQDYHFFKKDGDVIIQFDSI